MATITTKTICVRQDRKTVEATFKGIASPNILQAFNRLRSIYLPELKEVPEFASVSFIFKPFVAGSDVCSLDMIELNTGWKSDNDADTVMLEWFAKTLLVGTGTTLDRLYYQVAIGEATDKVSKIIISELH